MEISSVRTESRRKQTRYYQDMTLKHLPLMRYLKDQGLFHTTPEHDYRGVIKHSLLVADAAGTLGQLLELPKDDLEFNGLIHDSDKRIQFESMSHEEIMQDENVKTGILRATGNNFKDFETWSINEYILRYADSISALSYVPWREKIADYKVTKKEEGLMGFKDYGMGTWDKLLEIMEVVEKRLYEKVIEASPALSARYPESNDLQKMIEDTITERILNTG